ncbi:MAG: ArnT family glycosyltransferase, partial [Cyanobium sp.]
MSALNPAPVAAAVRRARRFCGARLWWVIPALLAFLLFIWELGAIGLVDETPPLFAASARRMAESGDWLIPSVNGLPRYDKPPLLYWLMGLLYGLPGWERIDPLGSWAAALPSALSATALLLLLAWLLRRHAAGMGSTGSAVSVALAFGLSPLVLLWSRIGVADLLFTAWLSAALISSWLVAVGAIRPRAWPLPWLGLGLAVLTKGPVALVLFWLSWVLFSLLQRDRGLALLTRFRPLRGVALSLLVCVPWYVVVVARDGWAFWNSFFGYHNVQRFVGVVNGHAAPWWFHLAMLVLASLPLTPLLLLQLWRCIRDRFRLAPQSLQVFCCCWLTAVLIFLPLLPRSSPATGC